jgi:hypothetical protein
MSTDQIYTNSYAFISESFENTMLWYVHAYVYAQCNCITRTLVYSQGDQTLYLSTLESQ